MSILDLLLKQSSGVGLGAKIVDQLSQEEHFTLVKQLEALTDREVSHVAGNLCDALTGARSLGYLRACGIVFVAMTLLSGPRQELIQEFEKEVGITRSKLYRMRLVWEVFGRRLKDQPAVLERFIPQALNKLAETWVSDDARDNAIAAAERGETINIKAAEKFTGRRPKPESSSTGKRSKASGPLFQHSSESVNVVIKRRSKGSAVDFQAIVLALEEALAKARQEMIDVNAGPLRISG
ncbi:hypothetical protein FF011L_12500 [Roseimaritima multifibrata]|uniref:Uncharacterized protein n=1 Tax=Roseimaritima multifibrata TaxID=1930274 RepID=A0A517MC87_9BACT|nr:hypothetical protein [Roseimaritima multifibrata]QDS92504.1 hypothetical protein FF011L_12500 [Roseimaritima multifibrata]